MVLTDYLYTWRIDPSKNLATSYLDDYDALQNFIAGTPGNYGAPPLLEDSPEPEPPNENNLSLNLIYKSPGIEHGILDNEISVINIGSVASYSNDILKFADVMLYIDGNKIMLKCKSGSIYENYYIRVLCFAIYNNGLIINSYNSLLELETINSQQTPEYIAIDDTDYFILQGTALNLYEQKYYKLQNTALHIATINI